MAAYFQMGHDTENLIGEEDLSEFEGIILSPVNRGPEELEESIIEFGDIGDYDIILDPQLYYPKTEREKLISQPYFPSDIDSSDYSSKIWWNDINDKLIKFAEKIEVNKICSPAVLPRLYNDMYYNTCVETCNYIHNKINKSDISVLCTFIININQITKDENILSLSSLISEADCSGFYLVLVTDVEPRLEIKDADEIYGIMYLIHLLEKTKKPVFVSHCSSDMILFKAAGATNCSSGKFFNLRRFTLSRFQEPSKGGGQLEYWFEQNLLSFIRGNDIIRLQKNDFEHIIGGKFSSNKWALKILAQLKEDSTKPWLRLSWRQYLSWFGKTENFLNEKDKLIEVRDWLKNAEENWLELDKEDLFFEEPKNDGKWIRTWRQGLRDFRKKISV